MSLSGRVPMPATPSRLPPTSSFESAEVSVLSLIFSCVDVLIRRISKYLERQATGKHEIQRICERHLAKEPTGALAQEICTSAGFACCWVVAQCVKCLCKTQCQPTCFEIN